MKIFGREFDVKSTIKKLWSFLANPRLIFCFLLGWMITNGWSYVLAGVGLIYDINWMKVVSAAYLAFLWLPISPEKIVTVAIAIALLKLLFPNDTRTLAVLHELRIKAKGAISRKKAEHRENKDKNK